MRHSALALLLLFGLSFGPSIGMLGGGDNYYGTGDSEARQNANDTDEAGAKETADRAARQKAAESRRTQPCNVEGSTCSAYNIKPAQ